MSKLEEVQTQSSYGSQRTISNHKILGSNVHGVLVHSSEIQNRYTTIGHAICRGTQPAKSMAELELELSDQRKHHLV
jgi:hypothetical protein